MVSLRSVGVMSCAKMMGAIYGSLGLIFLPLLLLGGFASMMLGRGSEALSGVALLFLAFLAPICYGAMGFIFGALTAWIYNLIAGWVGGIRLELKTEVVSSQ
ncbi:MAG: hypothetical protein WAQ52_02465 [Terriglobales bacterium]